MKSEIIDTQKEKNREELGSNECFLRFMAHRKGHTARRVTELSLEMPITYIRM